MSRLQVRDTAPPARKEPIQPQETRREHQVLPREGLTTKREKTMSYSLLCPRGMYVAQPGEREVLSSSLLN